MRTILAGWYRAARSTSGTQRIRALMFLAEQSWEFCWKQDALHRVFTDGESRPATTSDWEMLSRAISYGWLLVYLMEGEGQEARVLHQIGTWVPAQPLRPEDLPLLLQEHGLPPAGAAVLPSTGPGRAEVAERVGAPPTPLPLSLPEQRTAGAFAVNLDPCRGRPGMLRRFLVRAGIVGEVTLLLGSILLLTRNPWFCLGTLGLLVILILVLRRLSRPRTQARKERAQQHTPSANR